LNFFFFDRRIATGTFLKLNPNVSEGLKFISPKIEIHIKDDLNHDPLWSLETFIAAKFEINGLIIGENEIKMIFKITQLVFEVLEKVWQSIDYQLVDLKVEFGVITDDNHNKSIVLADIIDNETWRLWPKSDRKLMVDKQIYREYKDEEIDDKVIDHVRNVFQNVANLTQQLFSTSIMQLVKKESVIILVETENDVFLAQKLIKYLESDYSMEKNFYFYKFLFLFLNFFLRNYYFFVRNNCKYDKNGFNDKMFARISANNR
jgi:phosphoribosylaminoimidazole carboxylase/phosphoribosylaminoimidazole-succinocarboxamide synthase